MKSRQAFYRPISYPVSEWKLAPNNEDPKPGERVELQVVIGEVRNEKKEIDHYIIEPIFEDIVNLLLSEERKNYTLLLNLKQVPTIAIKYNNDMIIHNNALPAHYQAIRDTMDDISTDTIMAALADARNRGSSDAKGDGLKALEALVRTKTGVPYHTELILYALRMYFMETEDDPFHLHELFNSMTQEKVVEFIAAAREYEIAEETRNKRLGELLKQADIQTIQASMNKIVTTRYLLGLLR